jgi:polyisoprenoid-binding protein YceI
MVDPTHSNVEFAVKHMLVGDKVSISLDISAVKQP